MPYDCLCNRDEIGITTNVCDFSPGTHINEAVHVALMESIRLQLPLFISFNTLFILATPRSQEKDLNDYWERHH